MPLAAAPDDFGNALAYSAEDFVVITPSDSVALPFRCKAIYVGGAGDVAVFAKDGVTSVTFKAVPLGILWIRASYVKATGTTATNLLALR